MSDTHGYCSHKCTAPCAEWQTWILSTQLLYSQGHSPLSLVANTDTVYTAAVLTRALPFVLK